MNTITFLILFPSAFAVLCLLLPAGVLRDWVVRIGAAAVAAGSVAAGCQFLGGGTQFFEVHSHLIEELLFYGGLALGAYLLFCCRKITKREIYIPILILVQMAAIAWCEKSGKMPEVDKSLYVDSFSTIMALIVGLVGGLIAIYSVSYMREYHEHHPEVRDLRGWFFFTIFLFFGGMFGVVFSNNLSWLFFGWEITTMCSFLLIGYSGTEEATRNAFRALGLNVVGGLGFAAAIFLLTTSTGKLHTLALDELISLGPVLAMFPALLIAFAGLAKSAQMPFSSWLLGAMVAPSPVSALLHSSTMVKAGVFIIIKFAPVFQNTAGGYFIALIGGATFLTTSLMAVTQSNAKRVLAYSTIANLGLIVMCAGIGTAETLWAAILLTIFHAVAKALLFLGVGTTEHRIGSRDIEDMEGLVARQPALGVAILIGILGMFLAPFGMLISKYATIRALLDAHGIPGGGVFLAIILAFGSAPTLFFWAKWMGKLVGGLRKEAEPSGRVPGDERLALALLSLFTFFACVFFSPMAAHAIDPYVAGIYHFSPGIETDTLVAMIVMMGLLFAMPLLYLVIPMPKTYAPGYLAGVNIDGSASYRGAMGATRTVESRNYYMVGFFSESRLTWAAYGISALLILGMFIVPFFPIS
jgi:ech hydrogenase subunit A